MSDVEVVETRGQYRAVIGYDEYPSKPDGDFFGSVIWIDRDGRSDLMAHAYSHPPEDFGLGNLWEHYRDMSKVERYLRIYEGIVGFDYFDTQDGKYVNVVTPKDLEIWGYDSVEAYRQASGHEDPSHGNLDEWRAYVDGEVFFVRVEKNVTWSADDEDFEDRDEWTEIDDTQVYGYYGEAWAKQAALEALDVYTRPHVLKKLMPEGGYESVGVFANSKEAAAEAKRLGLQAWTTETIRDGFYALIEGTRTLVDGPAKTREAMQRVIDANSLVGDAYQVVEVTAENINEYEFLPDRGNSKVSEEDRA